MILFYLTIILLGPLVYSDKTRYAGTFHNGNYIWGGAMNIAWTELVTNIIHESIKLNTQKESAIQMLNIFNNPVFSAEDINPDDYYAKSGFGSETVALINRQMKSKFPQNTLGALKVYNMRKNDIISYAYLYKRVKYPTKFAKSNTIQFNGKFVKGFEAKTYQQKQNIFVNQYIDKDNFIIQLKTLDQDIELILLKSNQKLKIDQVVAKINTVQRGNKLQRSDICRIPNVKLDVSRSYKQITKIPLLNKGFENYQISSMIEKIKFDMDEVGVKVENSALIVLQVTSINFSRKRRRQLLINKPFWIIMKYRGKNPFFIANINVL